MSNNNSINGGEGGVQNSEEGGVPPVPEGVDLQGYTAGFRAGYKEVGFKLLYHEIITCHVSKDESKQRSWKVQFQGHQGF